MTITKSRSLKKSMTSGILSTANFRNRGPLNAKSRRQDVTTRAHAEAARNSRNAAVNNDQELFIDLEIIK